MRETYAHIKLRIDSIFLNSLIRRTQEEAVDTPTSSPFSCHLCLTLLPFCVYVV